MTRVARWWQRQVGEVGADRALSFYGAALALANVHAGVEWLSEPSLSRILGPGVAPICWPFFTTCLGLRRLTPGGVTLVVLVFMLFAALDAALFVFPQAIDAACALLAACVVARCTIELQDFRLLQNQHYMAVCVTVSFLTLPAKRQATRGLIVCMYVWAGILKLRPDSQWMSGGAFYGRRPLGLPASMIPLECAYVVALEVIVVFGLLSRRPWLFWLAFGQFIIFHVASFWVVGWPFPMLMFLLLSIFAFDRVLPRSPAGTTGHQFARGTRSVWRRVSLSTGGSLALLCAAQLIPGALSDDPAVTGEGRMFALNMFDAPVDCRATAFVHEGALPPRSVALRPPFLSTRVRCDPIVYLSAATDYCRAVDPSAASRDVDLTLLSRRFGTAPFDTIVAIRSVCRAGLRYDVWRHNSWIHSPPPHGRDAAFLGDGAEATDPWLAAAKRGAEWSPSGA